jgi:hypothetical protein
MLPSNFLCKGSDGRDFCFVSQKVASVPTRVGNDMEMSEGAMLQ